MKPKLYQYEACPFCQKVRTALDYKGMEYDIIEVHPLNKKEIEFSENYKKVPIYVDSEGKQIVESNAIMRHLDEEKSERPIFHSDEAGQKEAEWLQWSESLVQGLPTVIYKGLGNSIKAFDYISHAGNFTKVQKWTIKYSGAFIMSMVAKKIKKRQNIEDEISFLQDKIKEWTESFEGQSFNGGLEPNAADLAVYGIMKAVIHLNAGKIAKENILFSKWFERVSEMLKPATVASHG